MERSIGQFSDNCIFTKTGLCVDDDDDGDDDELFLRNG